MNRIEYTSRAGRRYPVEIHRRKGTRHMRLSLNVRNRIVLSLPWHCSDRAGQRFIEQNRSWLENQLASVPEVTGLATWLRRSPELSAGGRSLVVSLEASPTARASYTLDPVGGAVAFHLPEGSGPVTRYKLLLGFARDVLPERVAELAGRLGVDFRRVSVRDQSSRWGSCSARGTVSLNWRLILIPPRLQDYVIYHELAHLTEMNHSPRFWALLDTYDPRRVRHEQELDALTPTVMRVRE